VGGQEGAEGGAAAVVKGEVIRTCRDSPVVPYVAYLAQVRR